MKIVIALLVASCLSLSACWNLAVGPASPRPNVMLAQDKTPSVLALMPTIRNDYVIPGTGSVDAVPVRGWQSTLAAGFRNAFPTLTNSGRKLELYEAELSFAPAAVGMGGTAAVVAQIRYKARATDSAGKELGVLAGTVKAREANVSATEAGMTDNASKAVEALYETLATELFAKF
jgi:hypothetical protein